MKLDNIGPLSPENRAFLEAMYPGQVTDEPALVFPAIGAPHVGPAETPAPLSDRIAKARSLIRQGWLDEAILRDVAIGKGQLAALRGIERAESRN